MATEHIHGKELSQLTLWKEVVLNIPEAVRVPLGRVAGYLLLLEAPLGQLLAAGGQDASHEVVVKLDLGGDGLDGGAVAAADNLDPPHVVGVADTIL